MENTIRNLIFDTRRTIIYCFLFLNFNSYTQEYSKINPELLENKWSAEWISYPKGSLKDYGVFHFLKTIELEKNFEKFIIHVSADNRYRLFVNGEEIGEGPARGDLGQWRFETIDIAPYLRSGTNTIGAIVWNFGEFKHIAQMTNKTAFILQGNGEKESVLNTGRNWKVLKNEAYSPHVKKPIRTTVGPGDEVMGADYPYGWESAENLNSRWVEPVNLGKGIPYGKFTGWDWMLVPRNIPFMEKKLQRLKEVERTTNVEVTEDFLEGNSIVKIPANQKATILLDQTFLTTAYPELLLSGGNGSRIEIDYAESLINENGIKGNRDEVKGKTMLSFYSDVFHPDGGPNRKFQPLWFRTYRYLQLTIETKDNPLIIHDLYGYFRAYPFEENASFKSDDKSLEPIWNVGWRTARLCAGEIYYDCPYYEQLQYVADTRIQSLISLYVSGDDRLMRNAISQFQQSILPIGLTQSRYPSSEPQIIPPFSLFWIAMVHDYWMHRNDMEFVENQLNGVRNILYWFENNLASDRMLGPLDWWNFVDWSFGPWDGEKPVGGTPEGAIEGNSSILSLQYVHALQKAAELFEYFDKKSQAQDCRNLATKISNSVYSQCWDSKRELLSDSPKKKNFSQHANILAILTDLIKGDDAVNVMESLLKDSEITQATFYFQFYLVRALNKAGMAGQYLEHIHPWKEMLSLGLTTFAETPEPTRSDCHAWSASPNYEFLATVCGIKPSSPGFKTVSIEPKLGNLNFIEATMPHPEGEILLKVEKNNEGGIKGEVTLPLGVSGKFMWNNREKLIKEGKQELNFE